MLKKHSLINTLMQAFFNKKILRFFIAPTRNIHFNYQETMVIIYVISTISHRVCFFPIKKAIV